MLISIRCSLTGKAISLSLLLCNYYDFGLFVHYEITKRNFTWKWNLPQKFQLAVLLATRLRPLVLIILNDFFFKLTFVWCRMCKIHDEIALCSSVLRRKALFDADELASVHEKHWKCKKLCSISNLYLGICPKWILINVQNCSNINVVMGIALSGVCGYIRCWDLNWIIDHIFSCEILRIDVIRVQAADYLEVWTRRNNGR